MATSNTTVKDSAGAAGVTADGSPDEALGIDDVAQILGVSRWKVFDLIGRDPSGPAGDGGRRRAPTRLSDATASPRDVALATRPGKHETPAAARPGPAHQQVLCRSPVDHYPTGRDEADPTDPVGRQPRRHRRPRRRPH